MTALASAAIAGLCALPLSADAVGVESADTASGSACPDVVEPESMADAAELESMTTTIAGFGLRLPGSEEHNQLISWIEGQMRAVDGLDVTTSDRTITRWQPSVMATDGPGRDLAGASELRVVAPGRDVVIRTAGAIPDSSPTTERGVQGDLVYLPPDVPITVDNAAGKTIIRDVVYPAIPYMGLSLLSHYLTPDFQPDLAGNYERPYLAAQMYDDMAAADRVGAAGVIQAWKTPSRQMEGYYDPHQGSLFDVPGVWVGVDQAQRLKKLARGGAPVRTIVRAEVDEATTRDITAVLPGQTDQKVVLVTHTDGNTWVQENGAAGLIATARYLAGLPLACRTRSYEFRFTTGHLRYSEESTFDLARDLDESFEDGATAYVWAFEHLGTRAIQPVPRDGGPGMRLELTDNPEDYAWFAGSESPALSSALVNAVKGRNMTRSAVLRGMGTPVSGQYPSICSFGGLGTVFHARLVPTLAGISGPWSLWAPSFGKRAIDFDRMRDQVLVVADTILSLDSVASKDIAGAYMTERQRRAGGAPTCSTQAPPTEVD